MSERILASISAASISAVAALFIVFLNQVFDYLRRKEEQKQKGEDKYIERKILAFESSIKELEKVKFNVRQAHLDGVPFKWTKDQAQNHSQILTEKFLEAISALLPFNNEKPKHNNNLLISPLTMKTEIDIVLSGLHEFPSMFGEEDYDKFEIISKFKEVEKGLDLIIKRAREVFGNLYVKEVYKKNIRWSPIYYLLTFSLMIVISFIINWFM